MLTIKVRFPWGRYYAHPWGQNPVRITEAEWPPSPWRLLRAIAAAWFRKNSGEPPSQELLTLLQTLGRELPVMQLPAVSFGKTVHYHPNPGVPSGKVRHENHFVAVGGDVLFRWNLVNIPEQERADTAAQVKQLIDDLAGEIAYFGRAESICELSLCAEDGECDASTCATVVTNDQRPGRRIAGDCRDVFCPDPDQFRATDLWQRRDNGHDPSLAPKHLVQDLLDAPQPLPDGAAWYSYKMPAGWPERWIIRHPRPVKRKRDDSRLVAHFLEFSLQCRIPVPTKHVVSLATSFRATAIKRFKSGDPTRESFALSGHGRPEDVEGDHLHAFYLPIPDESGRSLERLRVWCRHGFTQREINALMSVGSLYWGDGRYPVRPVLLYLSREVPAPKPSTRWQSLTPFVAPRFWHRGKEGRARHALVPENQIVHCMRENGAELSCAVSRASAAGAADWEVCKVHLPPAKRERGDEPESRIGVRLRLQFESPVVLPLPAFGHSCHFGLGQFTPELYGDSQ